MIRVDLDGVVRPTKAVLLDFDGPVCAVFSGYPAPQVATDLRELLGARGVAFSPETEGGTDPLQLLRKVHHSSPEHYSEAEEFLTAAEVRSASSASPTPGAVEFMTACAEKGIPIAAVSNNSPESIHAFLEKHGLGELVEKVFGREKKAPHLMKPHPYLLGMAATALDVPPHHCLMVGDSTTDIEAAHALEMRAVGYADKPGKEAAFRALRCEAVIHDMDSIADAVRQRPDPDPPRSAN